MQLINTELLEKVISEAKESPRLRMNFNLHDSLEAPAQRLLNALEPGTVLPIHRHQHTAETYILLKGRVRLWLYNEAKEVIDTYEMDPLQGRYGVNVKPGEWHTLEVLEEGSVVFEVKDGPYKPFTPEDVLG